jgi:hypothetical protein
MVYSTISKRQWIVSHDKKYLSFTLHFEHAYSYLVQVFGHVTLLLIYCRILAVVVGGMAGLAGKPASELLETKFLICTCFN